MVGGKVLGNGHPESEMRARWGEGVKAVGRETSSEALLELVHVSANSSRNGAGLLSPIE